MNLVLDHQAMMILDIQVHCIMQFLYTIQCKPSLLLGKGWSTLCTCTFALICRYGDFFPKNAKERVYAIAMMLFTFIFYGLMLGKFANLVASYTFRRQRFKQRFEVIRKYLVSACSLARMYQLTIFLSIQKRACIKEDLQEKVIKFYEIEVYTLS